MDINILATHFCMRLTRRQLTGPEETKKYPMGKSKTKLIFFCPDAIEFVKFLMQVVAIKTLIKNNFFLDNSCETLSSVFSTGVKIIINR